MVTLGILPERLVTLGILPDSFKEFPRSSVHVEREEFSKKGILRKYSQDRLVNVVAMLFFIAVPELEVHDQRLEN